jgi:1,4-dihydroxy-2-naphthoate octaprenyltransferase
VGSLYIGVGSLYIDVGSLYIGAGSLYIGVGSLYIDVGSLYIDVLRSLFKYRTAIKALFLRFKLCPSAMLDSFSCSFMPYLVLLINECNDYLDEIYNGKYTVLTVAMDDVPIYEIMKRK